MAIYQPSVTKLNNNTTLQILMFFVNVPLKLQVFFFCYRYNYEAPRIVKTQKIKFFLQAILYPKIIFLAKRPHKERSPKITH